MSDKYTFLTQAPVHRVIGAMAIPTIISMLLTSMYNLVDTFFVGKINTQSTAAVGIVFSVMFSYKPFLFSLAMVRAIIFPVSWVLRIPRMQR